MFPSVSQRHSIPGRLRVRVCGLRRCRPLAAHVCSHLRAQPGIRSVEARPASESVIITYDAAQLEPPAILDAVRRLAAEAGERVSTRGELAVARQKPQGTRELAPLLLSSLSVALAVAEAPPILL